MEVEIGDSDVENIALQLMAAEDIHGHVDFLDEEARNPSAPPQPLPPPQPPQSSQSTMPQRRRVTLRNTDGTQQVQPADIGDDGAFKLLKVLPRKYRVTLTGSSRVYVKSMQLGQTGMEGGILDLRNGSGGALLSLRVASATGVVEVTVTDEKGPVTGARVGLAEERERVGAIFAATKEDGSYTFNGVAPGKYKVLAVDDVDVGAISHGNIEDYEDVAESIEVADHQTVKKDLKKK